MAAYVAPKSVYIIQHIKWDASPSQGTMHTQMYANMLIKFSQAIYCKVFARCEKTKDTERNTKCTENLTLAVYNA